VRSKKDSFRNRGERIKHGRGTVRVRRVETPFPPLGPAAQESRDQNGERGKASTAIEKNAETRRERTKASYSMINGEAHGLQGTFRLMNRRGRKPLRKATPDGNRRQFRPVAWKTGNAAIGKRSRKKKQKNSKK